MKKNLNKTQKVVQSRLEILKQKKNQKVIKKVVQNQVQIQIQLKLILIHRALFQVT